MTSKWAIVIGVTFLPIWLAPGRADANRMCFTQANIPARLGERGLKRFICGRNARRINEEDDHKTWKFKIGVFLNHAANDLEAHILFYDVEDGPETFVSDMTVFLSNRDERSFLQPVTIERPMFKPNNRYMAAFQIKRRRLARNRFELVGRGVERSGMVAFTEAETVDPEEAAVQEAARREAEAREEAARGGETELEARERLAAEQEALGGTEEPLPEDIGEYSHLFDEQQTAPESGGCASCAAAGRGSEAGTALAVVLVVGLFGLRRRPR